MLEVVDILVSWIATTVLLFYVVNRDERRLAPERLERAWPESTKRVAIVLLGPLCLPVHYTRTRRSFGGFLLGIGWLLVVIVASTILSLVIEAISEALS